MKLKDRKNTTTKGLKEAEKLMECFNFSKDIDEITSNSFYGRYEEDNGKMTCDVDYRAWVNTEAHLRIINGVLQIVSLNAVYCGEKIGRNVEINDFTQLNFKAFTEEMIFIIDLYNIACAEKDTQIQEFLDFCELYKNL